MRNEYYVEEHFFELLDVAYGQGLPVEELTQEKSVHYHFRHPLLQFFSQRGPLTVKKTDRSQFGQAFSSTWSWLFTIHCQIKPAGIERGRLHLREHLRL
jgi:hypothetical protein